MPKGFETIGKECHDCGQNGSQWCSINHGVLLCDECCSVHLSLGRHVSQIKSFKRNYWSPSQLNLINELSSNGANFIWEYSLRDPQNKFPRKKPSAKDPLSTKADFIRTKYQQMAYINRLKDETRETFEDLNLQLHSIVRTDNIITCLRFLSQDADPNFRNPETGTSSIHVAASRGQSNQIELLCIFGGNPAKVDAAGISPEEHARTNGYVDLADRLIELQYELTDRLTCFIGGKLPNHKTNQHIVLPELNENFDNSSQTLAARQKLQQLPNSIFEDLAMDVFDEVERRELKTIWHAQVDQELIPLHVVPFLPVNPSFSATRNQGRQKLARYELKDFNRFIYDILNEVSRRYYDFIQQPSISSPTKCSPLPRQTNDSTIVLIDSDDEPFYDKVASEDEYSNYSNKKQQKPTKLNKKSLKKLTKKQSSDDVFQFPPEDASLFNDSTGNQFSSDLKSRIMNTEIQVKYLACAHTDLKNELSVLHQMIQRLLDENLVNKIDRQVVTDTSTISNFDETNRRINKPNQRLFDNHSRKSSPFIESDYDNTTMIDVIENSSSPNLIRTTLSIHDKRSSRTMQRFPLLDDTSSNNIRSYRSTDIIIRNSKVSNPTYVVNSSEQPPKQNIPIHITRSRSCSGGRNTRNLPQTLLRKGSFNRPDINHDVDKRTREITQRIGELYSSIKTNQTDRYGIYAEEINNSVQNMMELSERLSFNEDIRANLDMLNTSAQQLLDHTTFKGKDPTMQIQFIVDDCYRIALATRNLSSLYQKM
ncbi:unnamed protein product [Rotaria magnacalcarata]|uniref:Arf-GAP domain-containing protein n=2 Tax=Rotaria magnacalcarata TaxID=392030 RepID=A0A816MZI9_9BILA|nr:unnamed protein product [Rotaria magnacalcarata]CAF2127013.1 unnamed protein product [Rotaria magnacalcarata]CAF3783377.1 unnamed protein product [Rotaria magnacalcarata]CAF3840742.1 unnamed protein product [Rotaria magnacalcarata]